MPARPPSADSKTKRQLDRGKLVAESRCDVPEVLASVDHHVYADIRDAAGDVVGGKWGAAEEFRKAGKTSIG